jgi:arabinofuranosyltransferase
MKHNEALVVCIAAAIFAVVVLPLRGSVVDDTYIHLQYARNLAETGQLSFNRGDPVYGATSPLWVFLLAAVDRAGGDLLVSCRVLSWLFAVGSILLVYRLAAALGGRGAAASAALVLACEAWFVRWSAVGMETSFAVFMILLALEAGLDAPRSARRSALFGLVLFLAVLARPEALVLAALSTVAYAFSPAPPARRWLHLAVFIPLFAIWLFVIHRHTGSYFPLTAGAKQGRPVLSAALFGRALVPAKIMGATILLPWLALIAGLARSLVRERSLASTFVAGDASRASMRPGVFLMILWVFALPAAYVVLDFQVLSRYLVPVIPCVIVLGVASWIRLSALLWRRASARRVALAIFTALVMSQSMVFYARVVVAPTVRFSDALKTVVVGMGEWLARNSAPDALVATPDIGAIGFTSGRRVLDLGGLVTPEINAMRRATDVAVIIDDGLYLAFKPDYLVDRSPAPARFAGKVIGGYTFAALRSGEVPNLGIRKPEPVVYTLYRITPVSEEGAR